jgi:hypothetical protein
VTLGRWGGRGSGGGSVGWVGLDSIGFSVWLGISLKCLSQKTDGLLVTGRDWTCGIPLCEGRRPLTSWTRFGL